MSRGHGPRLHSDDGFSLVEVLTVVIILGILAAIALSTFLGQREKAERSRAVSSLRNAETFAVAINSDAGIYSECIDDYVRAAGGNAPYIWLEDGDGFDTLGSGASGDANQISVYGPQNDVPCEFPNDGPGWVSMAALANDTCYYQVLVPGTEARIRHQAPAQASDPPICEGSEIEPAAQPGRVLFRDDATPREPSGW